MPLQGANVTFKNGDKEYGATTDVMGVYSILILPLETILLRLVLLVLKTIKKIYSLKMAKYIR